MSFLISTLSALGIMLWVLWGKTTSLPTDKRLVKTLILCILFMLIYTIINSICYDFVLFLFKKFGSTLYFVTAAICEEFIKFLAVYFATDGFKNLRRKIDIILYAVVSACSFAVFENFFYCLIPLNYVGILRCIYSVPSHIMYSMGVMIFALRYLNDLKTSNVVLGILVMGFIHGFSNLCLMSGSVISVAAGSFIGFAFEIIIIVKIINEYKKCFYRYLDRTD